MKPSFLISAIVLIFFSNYSIGRVINNGIGDILFRSESMNDNSELMPDLNRDDVHDTLVSPRPPPQKRTTTPINRVSKAVSIAVPVALFGATFLIGYGLITFAFATGDHGLRFLRRTRRNPPVQRQNGS